MLNNASTLPPKPIHDLAESGSVIDPALGRPERMPDRRQLLPVPKRAEDVPSVVEPILRRGVVVLRIHRSVSNSA